ncbi:MAG: glycosyltransferase family 2 protein [Candidatus Schekmanbacteria bacterium]|nr:glycosyltransferase family 2 protein [Candidatus Schekmanbacteria bacterium]
MEKISISVSFPCYNEESNVEKLVRDASQFLPSISSDYEIIVVDDGSADRTAEIAEKLAKEIPNVRVIRHGTNKGYGAALRTGFENSRKQYLFFTDGDNQFDITELTKLVPYTKDFDIVAGYRIKRRDNFMRRLNAWSFKTLVRILFGLKIRDLNCAFKIFRKEVIDNVKMESNGAFINAEIHIGAKKKGYTMKEVGVNHYPRQWGTQTGANPRVIFKAFHELYKLRKRLS